jgi:hypothetical protein
VHGAYCLCCDVRTVPAFELAIFRALHHSKCPQGVPSNGLKCRGKTGSESVLPTYRQGPGGLVLCRISRPAPSEPMTGTVSGKTLEGTTRAIPAFELAISQVIFELKDLLCVVRTVACTTLLCPSQARDPLPFFSNPTTPGNHRHTRPKA